MHRPCRRERFTGPCRVQTCAEARRKMILPAGSAGCSTSPDQHQCVSLHGYLGLPELVRYDDASLRCTSWAASAFARALAALTPALAGAGGEATLDPTSPSLPRVPVDATVTGAGGGNAVAGDVAGGRGAATGCGSPSRALAAEYRAMRRWFSCMTGPASCSTCARLAWHATPSNSPPREISATLPWESGHATHCITCSIRSCSRTEASCDSIVRWSNAFALFKLVTCASSLAH